MSTYTGLTPTSSAGATLIEVALSLLLVSIAAVGLAGLQLTAKYLNFQALQRSQASVLAQDLLERMRVNRTALSRYATDGIGTATGAVSNSPLQDCGSHACVPIELHAWDMWQWESALSGSQRGVTRGGLRRPAGCVAVAGGRVDVTITWAGRRGVSDQSQDTDCGRGLYGGDEGTREVLQVSSFIGPE